MEAWADVEIAAAVQRFEALAVADPLTMFDHVFAEPPPHLLAQRADLAARLQAAPPDGRAPSGAPPAPTPMRGQRVGRP